MAHFTDTADDAFDISHIAGNASDELSLCYAWARDCRTLRHVIFPSKTEWMQADDETWFPLPPSPTTAYPPLLNY